MLELSTKHALKVLLHLAAAPQENFTQVQVISSATDVPGPYLSKIIKQLAARGVVETRRGSLGGVRLPKDFNVSFYDVCVALDDPIVMQSCFLTKSQCGSKNPCAQHQEWQKMRSKIFDFLKMSKITASTRR